MYITTTVPVSYLSRNMEEIEKLTISEGEIVEVAKNSKDYMVVMSKDTFRKMLKKMEMYESLLISEAQIRKGMSMPWEEAKVKSDKKFKEKMDAFNAKKATTKEVQG